MTCTSSSVLPKKRVLVYSESDIARDPRVSRQIAALSELFEIVVFGTAAPAQDVQEYHDISNLLRKVPAKLTSWRRLVRMFRLYGPVIFLLAAMAGILKRSSLGWLGYLLSDIVTHGRVSRVISSTRADVLVANDIQSLRTLSVAKGKRRLLYDAHEYSPGQYIRHPKTASRERFVRHVLRRHLGRVDAMTTVSGGISRLYKSVYGAPQPTVINNATAYTRLFPTSCCNGRIRLVHHGAAVRVRHLEVIMDAIEQLDSGFSLDLYLVAQDDEYYHELKTRTKGNGRVRIRQAVSRSQLVQTLNEYDLGVVVYPPVTYNLYHVLPNKFFEFVQARLGIVTGPSPEIVRYVEEYGLGVVTTDFTPSAIASALSGMSNEDVMRFKSNAHLHAHVLSAESETRKFVRIVEDLVDINSISTRRLR
jgi:hypothetical protein